MLRTIAQTATLAPGVVVVLGQMLADEKPAVLAVLQLCRQLLHAGQR